LLHVSVVPIGVVTTVQLVPHDCRQLQEIGPLPHAFGTQMVVTVPAWLMTQISPDGHVALPGPQLTGPQGATCVTQLPLRHWALVRPLPFPVAEHSS
jgi:hypothetical protein